MTNGGLFQAGDGGFGIFSLGGSNIITNNVGGTITAGVLGMGINLSGDGNAVVNAGAITVGAVGVGIQATGANNIITNSGTITATGFSSFAIIAGINNTIVNSGDIIGGSGVSGIVAFDNSTVTNAGRITVGSVGITAFNNSVVINTGAITGGNHATGIMIGESRRLRPGKFRHDNEQAISASESTRQQRRSRRDGRQYRNDQGRRGDRGAGILTNAGETIVNNGSHPVGSGRGGDCGVRPLPIRSPTTVSFTPGRMDFQHIEFRRQHSPQRRHVGPGTLALSGGDVMTNSGADRDHRPRHGGRRGALCRRQLHPDRDRHARWRCGSTPRG